MEENFTFADGDITFRKDRITFFTKDMDEPYTVYGVKNSKEILDSLKNFKESMTNSDRVILESSLNVDAEEKGKIFLIYNSKTRIHTLSLNMNYKERAFFTSN